MYHKQRWTPEKIKQRINLIAPLVYIKRKSLPSFKYLELANPLTPDYLEMFLTDKTDKCHW